MKTWDDWSDFEINKAVVKALNIGKVFAMFVDDDLKIVYMDPLSEDAFDPCNSWADIGPIIFNNRICLTSMIVGRRSKQWAASWNEDGGRWSNGDIVAGHSNPLRAAAIVFLEMNGVKP